MLEIEGRDRYRAPFVLEGGAIHVDGEGTLITTEECLLNPNRNPHMDTGQLEIMLHEYLGISSVIWLGKGVIDDETDGHVDNLCCFARPGEVVLTWTDNKRDPQYRVSHDAYERLMGARDAKGRRLKVHKLQQPGPLHRTREEAQDIDTVDGRPPRPAGERLAGSYVNFYIANSTVVVPLLDSRHDRQATPHTDAHLPRAARDRRAGTRDPARRRQHPLHHPASPCQRRCWSGCRSGFSPTIPQRK